MKNKNLIKTLGIYFIIFYLVWAVFTLWLMPIIDLLPNETLSTIVKSGILKNLVWTIPAGLLIKKYHDSVEIPLKDMFTNRVNWLKYLPIFFIFTICILVTSYKTNGNLQISSNFGLDDIIVVLFVGLTEELVFRGWLLNSTIKDKKDDDLYIPIGINALLFLSIHFPRWIVDGLFITNFVSLGFIQILILSVVFSYVFIKSRNILIPIALHMYWDLLVFMF